MGREEVRKRKGRRRWEGEELGEGRKREAEKRKNGSLVVTGMRKREYKGCYNCRGGKTSL